MGEYTGRRRGRPASEPEPEPQYGYQEPSYEYGYEAPSYEAPSYETYGYESAQYVEPEAYAAPGYGFPEQQYTEQQYPEQYAEAYGEQYAEQYQQYSGEYAEQYTEPYYGEYYEQYTEEPVEQYGEENTEQYVEQYADDYAEPRFEPRRRSAPAADQYAAEYAPEYAQDYDNGYDRGYDNDYDRGYDYASPAPPRREALPLISHLPFLGASTAALIVASFVSAKAVAAVVLPLQLLVAWAILDLAGHASRRTAAFVALAPLAATVGAFTFQADESATAVAGGLGAGFFLLAADAVLRAARRGIEPGTVRVLAAAGSALLFAGLTGLSVPAARLDTGSVAVGAAAGALAGLVAARNPELGSSRVVVVALPAITAALASYAAAILMA